jgi:ATP adenylyltransferase
MEHLWSPWRMKYMEQDNQEGKCIFCDAIQADQDVKMLIVFRGKWNFVMLNRFPYTSGHVMLVPYLHRSSLEDFNEATQLELFNLITRSTHIIQKVYHPDGFNIGANIGVGSGAGVLGHVHLHIVPRWGGDSNFMTTIGDTRVIPEDLSQTLKKFKDSWI